MKKIIVPIFAIAVLSASCGKDYNRGTGLETATYASIEDVFSQLSLKPKVVTMDAAAGGSFYGNSGTRYEFPANGLVDATGNPVTGNVQVSVTEYLQKGDMIFSEALPVSDGEPLLSGGEINVNVEQGGKELFLKPGVPFTAHVPTSGDTTSGLELFIGQPASHKGTTGNKINWIQRRKDSIKANNNTIRYHYPLTDTLDIVSDSLRFCNADCFMKSPNYQTFTITIAVKGASVPSQDALFTYAIYDGKKSLWKCGWYGAPVNNVYSEHHMPDIPVHFVSFVLINGKFYGGIQAAIPKTGENYTVNLTEVDAASFKASVNLLK